MARGRVRSNLKAGAKKKVLNDWNRRVSGANRLCGKTLASCRCPCFVFRNVLRLLGFPLYFIVTDHY